MRKPIKNYMDEKEDAKRRILDAVSSGYSSKNHSDSMSKRHWS